MKIVKNRFIYFSISIAIVLLGFIAMGYNAAKGNGAFNYDIQFTGGTSIDVDLGQTFENGDIANLVSEITGESSAQIQKYGSEGTGVVIKTKSLDDETRNAIKSALVEKYGVDAAQFSIEDVSGTISREMQKNALLSVFVACLAMLIYVTIRFKDVSTGASSIIALTIDALVVVGSYALFRIPLNNSFIAAVLTIIGYSINSTIIIFDRVRENKRIIGRNNYQELVDVSVTQTLKRTVFTSMTTFLTIFCLYLFGVQSIKEFALPICIGVVCGTYSSIFVAGNIWYTMCTAKSKK